MIIFHEIGCFLYLKHTVLFALHNAEPDFFISACFFRVWSDRFFRAVFYKCLFFSCVESDCFFIRFFSCEFRLFFICFLYTTVLSRVESFSRVDSDFFIWFSYTMVFPFFFTIEFFLAFFFSFKRTVETSFIF